MILLGKLLNRLHLPVFKSDGEAAFSGHLCSLVFRFAIYGGQKAAKSAPGKNIDLINTP